MRIVPAVISLLVLINDVLAQAGSAPRTHSSVFSGILYYNLSLVREPEKLVQENKTMQVQTDVCSQITSLIPWYEEQKNTSTCTINIDKQQTYVNYTILATDDFVRKYDPSCVTYDILLANQVQTSLLVRDKYCLVYIELETRNRTQPVGPFPADTGSTTIRVDGPLYKQGRKLRWDEVTNTDVVTKEVGENVRELFTLLLNLSQDNGSHINTERHQIYKEPTDQTLARMEAQITFNNSWLAASGINYTCPPFKQLVKVSLESPAFYSDKSYLWKPVNLVEEKSDGRSADTRTASPASDQTSANNGSVTTVRTTTRGGEVETPDGRSADTTTASTAPDQTSASNDSVITMRTTTRGGGAGINWCLVSIILPVLTLNALHVIH